MSVRLRKKKKVIGDMDLKQRCDAFEHRAKKVISDKVSRERGRGRELAVSKLNSEIFTHQCAVCTWFLRLLRWLRLFNLNLLWWNQFVRTQWVDQIHEAPHP